MTVFLLSLLGLMVDSCCVQHGDLSWLVSMAAIPTIWIARNRSMKEKIKKIRIFPTKCV